MALHDGCRISELFHGIQGESTFAGLPCSFIRFWGCNLRCAWCDARYTYEEKGDSLGVKEILRFVDSQPHGIVEITGGEPLLQESVYPLMEELLLSGRTVLLETNGTIPFDRVPKGVVKIMDVKCPGSGMEGKTHLPNLECLAPRDEIKFVLSSRHDYEWALEFVRRYRLEGREILFSPVFGFLAGHELAAWILADGAPVRLQLQLHKILWPEVNRGK